MARNDIKIISQLNSEYSFPGLNPVVASGTSKSIVTGEPSKWSTGVGVAAMVDGNGTTSERFAGICKEDSTETVAAAGRVVLFMPLPGIVYAAKAKSAVAADTQAEIDALFGKRVVLDLTSTVWTIDTAAVDAATNAINIIGGEFQTSTIYFTVQSGGNIL